MITSLRLQQFRSYGDESFEFEPMINIVVGPNAVGKTNLLEAILVLAQGGSYRAADNELVRFGKPWSRLDGYFGSQKRALKLERGPGSEKTRKQLIIDGREYSRLSLDLTVPVVVFEPTNLQQLTRGPEQRRELIDGLLLGSRAGFKGLKNHYLRALAQRNRLLKNPRFNADELFAWDVRLCELGEQIAQAREALVTELNQNIAAVYSSIANKKSHVEVSYRSGFNVAQYSSLMLKKLKTNHALDVERGFTGCGPHREDIVFELNGEPVESAASRGETRSLTLAIKVFELQKQQAARGKKPIFLLDDVFSELDSARRRALVSYLKNQQTIITTTDADAVTEYFLKKAYHIIPINSKN